MESLQCLFPHTNHVSARMASKLNCGNKPGTLREKNTFTTQIRDLVRLLGDLCDDDNKVVLEMDVNDKVRDGDLTKALWDIGMYEAVVSSHKEKSFPTTCTKNHQRTPIDSIWTSSGLGVLR